MKSQEPEQPVAAALTYEQLKGLIEAGKTPSITKEDLAVLAPRKPENAVSPGVSVFSYPEGELVKPKPKLKCKMWIGGGPIEHGTVTPEEIEALNAMTPGKYRIELTDGAMAYIEVKGQIGANGAIEKLWILIPEEFPNKNGFGKLTTLVRQFTDANRVETAAA